MHELTVTESILEIALRHAKQAGGGPITDIYLVIGQLSSIIDDSVQFYWDMVAEGSPAQGARLHFQRLPADLLCLGCGLRYQPAPGELTCLECGGAQIKVISGDEFYVEAIEVLPVEAGGTA